MRRSCGKSTSAILAEQVSEAVYNATFKDIRGLYLDENCLTIEVPTKFIRERIDQRYRELILAALSDVHPHSLGLEIRVDDDEPTVPRGPRRSARRPHPRESSASADAEHRRTTAPIRLRCATDRRTSIRSTRFDAFVTGPSNRFAHAAALVGGRDARPCLQPAVRLRRRRASARPTCCRPSPTTSARTTRRYQVRYISTETFLNQFVDAIRNNAQTEFKRRYREIDVLLVDDIQFIEGKEQLQEEFFHTFNTLHEANRQIVLSSDRPPDAIATLEDRLRSRFKMGLITDIQPPDLETRLAILRKKAEQSNTPISARGARVHRHPHHQQHP